MSLRGRLLLTIVVANLAVAGVVQLATHWWHLQQADRDRAVYTHLLQALMADVAPDRPDRADARWVRKLLTGDSMRRVFRDIVVNTGDAAGAVDLNPMGAAHRDPRTFPMARIRDGIRQAIEEQESVPVAGGLCVAAWGRAAAGAWCLPIEQPGLLPFAFFAVPLLVSTVLVGLLAFIRLNRSVVLPLQELGAAATRVGAGEAGVRVVPPAAAPELNEMVAAFNQMAARVAGHTEELEREVERATEEAARRERALVVSSRLAAMGTLAAGIAHEINNPLGGMLNAVHRLRQREDLDPRAARYLELVHDGLERVGAIARRVLDFSPRAIEAAPFRLRDAVDSARALVEHRCRHEGVDLAVDVAADLPEVAGERHEIQQVILNCLINALDALSDQSTARRIDVQATRETPWVRLTIADNGPGASSDTLARAFDPFFTSKGPQSSGLGLFISFSIVRNHGGELSVESAPGAGFRVEIRLPEAGPGEARPEGPRRLPEDPPL
ncbi:MAG: ATP-binding protein [Planctomycetota bacterium]